MHFHWTNKIFWLALGLLVGCGSNSASPVATAVIEPTIEISTEIVPTPIPQPSPTTVPEGPLTLTWTAETGAAINHPPLPIGNVLAVFPSRSPVVALDIETGVERWRYEPAERIWDRAYASDGRLLFIGLSGGKLAAVDAQDGSVVWQKELGIEAQLPLVVSDGVLYVVTTFVGPGLIGDPTGKAKLFALNPEDGEEIWQVETDNYILQTPFRLGDSIYVSGSFDSPDPVDEGGQMRLYALSAKDGSVRWTFESEDGFTKQVFANDTAVSFIAYQDFISGLDSATGELIWRRDTGNWVPTLSGAEDTVYFGSANTVVHAINLDDGAVKWQFNIPEGSFNYVLGAPVSENNRLYFLTQQGDIFALDAESGTPFWQVSTPIAARTGLSIAGSWLIVGDEEGGVYGFKLNE